jgi:hypothetical protein
MAAERGERIALLIVGDDVRMNVDRLACHRGACSEKFVTKASGSSRRARRTPRAAVNCL